MQVGSQTDKYGEMGSIVREKSSESIVKLASASDDSSSAQLHPWLNPELHPCSDLDWQGINSEDQPKSLQFHVHLKTFQAEPTVELWLSI